VILAGIWLAAAIAAIVTAPRWAARIGDQLSHDEGLVMGTGKIAQTAAEIEAGGPQSRPA